MIKKIMKLILPVFILCIVSACSTAKTKSEPITLKVSVPDGIPALTMAKLIKENTQIDPNISLQFTIEKTTDSLAAKVLSKEADIAIVPSNLAAQCYNKELGYQVAATGSWGSFYLISEEKIDDITQLKGKTITTIGKNLTPDIMLRHLLQTKGIQADQDVTIEYLNGATELAPNFIGGKAKIVAVPEPMLSTILTKKPNTQILLDFNQEWKTGHESSNGYPQSSFIVKKDIAFKHKKFIEKLLAEYEQSIHWANTNPTELGNYAEELQLAVNKEVLPDAVQRANMKYVNITQSKADYHEFFKVLFEIEPKIIGGKIPDEGLYFQ